MTATIQMDGSIAITLSPQEQGMAQMILADLGPTVFSEVFNLQFQLRVRDVMNSRFARLAPQDQADLLMKMAQAPA